MENVKAGAVAMAGTSTGRAGGELKTRADLPGGRVVGVADSDFAMKAKAALDSTRDGLTADGSKTQPLLHLRDNALDAFRFGAIMDYRLRLAGEILAHSTIGSSLVDAGRTAKDSARYVLDMVSGLIELGQERGLIEPLDSPEAEAIMLAHIKRGAKYQIGSQLEQQREMQDAQKIVGAVAGAFSRGTN